MTDSVTPTNDASASGKPARLARTMGALLHFVRTQGSQASTWRGLALLISACGIYLRPEMIAAITAVGMAVSGLIGVAMPDAAAER